MAAAHHHQMRAGIGAAFNKNRQAAPTGFPRCAQRGIQLIAAHGVFPLLQQLNGIPDDKALAGAAPYRAVNAAIGKHQHFAVGAGRPLRFHKSHHRMGDPLLQQFLLLFQQLQSIHLQPSCALFVIIYLPAYSSTAISP